MCLGPGVDAYTLSCGQSLRSCLTLCKPMDCSPPGSSVHGIHQARMAGVGLSCHSAGDLLHSRTEPVSPKSPPLQANSLLLSHLGSPTYTLILFIIILLRLFELWSLRAPSVVSYVPLTDPITVEFFLTFNYWQCRCSRLIFLFPVPGHRISHFYRKSQFP